MSKGENASGGIDFFVKALVSAIMGMILTVILLMGFALILNAGAGLQSLMNEYVIVCVIAGSAFAGARCAKKRGGGVLVAGLLAAICYVLILTICSLLKGEFAENGAVYLKNAVAAMCGGLFGGTLLLYRKTKKSRLRR